MSTKDYAIRFTNKYGDNEIELPRPVVTIRDSRPDPFSSGSDGHITKARRNGDTLEFYHDWWAYGWVSHDEMERTYPEGLRGAINVLGL